MNWLRKIQADRAPEAFRGACLPSGDPDPGHALDRCRECGTRIGVNASVRDLIERRGNTPRPLCPDCFLAWQAAASRAAGAREREEDRAERRRGWLVELALGRAGTRITDHPDEPF